MTDSLCIIFHYLLQILNHSYNDHVTYYSNRSLMKFLNKHLKDRANLNHRQILHTKNNSSLQISLVFSNNMAHGGNKSIKVLTLYKKQSKQHYAGIIVNVQN